MPRRTAPLAFACLLAACAPDQPDSGEPTGEATAEPANGAASPAADLEPTNTTVGETNGRAHRFTSLANCPITREERREMPFVERRCEGPGGYDLKITDSDARNNLIVVAPDGTETSLNLSRIGNGGFSTLGDTAEWRSSDAASAPDSLVVRYQVAEQPHPAPETSYLIAVRLTPTPCVVGQIAPGPGQNESARAAADRPGPCLE